MSTPQPAQPAKLVVGIFTSCKSLLEPVANDLMARFGPIDMVSPWFVFNQTDYYHKEMGAPLYRRMLVFKELISQEALADIKQYTNALERQYTSNDRRRINIDPGYLLHERFVLATGKNYSHRIYLSKGIYADLTLIFQKGQYQPVPWTYPDYADLRMRQYLELIRKKYGFDLKRTSHA